VAGKTVSGRYFTCNVRAARDLHVRFLQMPA
jgi:hypothetical protein